MLLNHKNWLMILEGSGQMLCNFATYNQKKRMYSDKFLVRWQITESTYAKQDGYTITKWYNLTCTELLQIKT